MREEERVGAAVQGGGAAVQQHRRKDTAGSLPDLTPIFFGHRVLPRHLRGDQCTKVPYEREPHNVTAHRPVVLVAVVPRRCVLEVVEKT